MENTYINHAGSAFLTEADRRSIRWVQDILAWIAFVHRRWPGSSSSGAMGQRGDEAEVEGFYQKVRRNARSDWKQYYLCGKLLKGRQGSFIYMGLEIDKRNDSVYYLNKQLDIPPIGPVTFSNSASSAEGKSRS